MSGLLNESHTDFTIPKEHFYTNIFSENEKLDPCRRFKSKFEGGDHDCVPENFYDNETVPCDAYIYSREIFTNTLTTDIDLVKILMIKRVLVGSRKGLCKEKGTCKREAFLRIS
jgi:hypothetical protein